MEAEGFVLPHVASFLVFVSRVIPAVVVFVRADEESLVFTSQLHFHIGPFGDMFLEFAFNLFVVVLEKWYNNAFVDVEVEACDLGEFVEYVGWFGSFLPNVFGY